MVGRPPPERRTPMTDPLSAAPPSARPPVVDGNGVALQPLADRVCQLKDRVLAEVRRVVVGMDGVTEQLLIALLANGHVLLADEVNRAPAKTQSALLEAMQEYQVTIDGDTLPLPLPFLVLATQNPVEQEGVYRLPEAQLDRFLLRVEMGYPGRVGEVAMLRLHSGPVAVTEPVLNAEQILDLQAKLPAVYGDESLYEYIVLLAEESRRHPDVSLGASPRAALNLLKCA